MTTTEGRMALRTDLCSGKNNVVFEFGRRVWCKSIWLHFTCYRSMAVRKKLFFFQHFSPLQAKWPNERIQSFDSSMFFEMGLRLVSPEDPFWLGNGLISRKMTRTSLNRVDATHWTNRRRDGGATLIADVCFFARARAHRSMFDTCTSGELATFGEREKRIFGVINFI